MCYYFESGPMDQMYVKIFIFTFGSHFGIAAKPFMQFQ